MKEKTTICSAEQKGDGMKYCFIINPASGKPETKANLENKINQVAKEKGIDVTVLYTRKAGDARELIVSFTEEHWNEDIQFYACGGDGTLCEAVNGMMAIEPERRERVSLGVVPVGTGNDFVRSFENNELFSSIAAQMDAENIRIDLMRCNDFYAVNMINIGFDCQVVVKTGDYKKKKYIPSKMAYICGLIATLVKKPSVNMTLTNGESEGEKKNFLLTTFAKGNFCGGGFNSNPEASLTDGKINALFVNNISRIRFVSIVGKYKTGTHLCPKYADILTSEKAEEYLMRFNEPTDVSVDGEIVKTKELRLSCIRGAVNFLVPKGAAYIKALTSVQPETAGV